MGPGGALWGQEGHPHLRDTQLHWLCKSHCIAMVDSSHTCTEDNLCKPSQHPVVIQIDPKSCSVTIRVSEISRGGTESP